MLPSRYRLRHKADLQHVRRRGRAFRHPLAILLQCATNRQDEYAPSRFAFVASRRVGNAVQRNRAKRLLREAIHLHLVEISGARDFILIARSRTPQATFQEVETAVLQLLTRARVLD